MFSNAKLKIKVVTLWSLSLTVLMTMLNCAIVHAEVKISLGEQKAWLKEDTYRGRGLRYLFWQGTGGSGHSTLYVSELCSDGSFFKVRMCTESDVEKGVYISFIGGLSGGHSWIAVPANLYLYGVEKAEDRPIYATTFNKAYYLKKEAGRKGSKKTSDYLGTRNSSVDLARETFFGSHSQVNLGGDPTTADKANLFVTSERDVYNIVIHGDTVAEAKKLLAHFESVPNQTQSRDKRKVEGPFTIWRNCTVKVNEWTSIMFGPEISIGSSFSELKIETPRHYMRLVLEKIGQLQSSHKWDREVSIEYIPKIASDRSASLGFGSPAHSLYDPRTIGGAMLWIHEAPIAAGFLLANERNIRFSIAKELEKRPSLEIGRARASVKKSNDLDQTESQADVERLTNEWFGTQTDWMEAGRTLATSFESVEAKANLPVELRMLIKKFASNRGQFASAVADVMSHRSQASRVGAVQYVALHFKRGEELSPGQFLLSDSDENNEEKTGVSIATIGQGSPSLAIMLMLAIGDNYLAEKPENRPSWAEMKIYLQTLQTLISRM